VAAIRDAVESRVNWIDMAAVYGLGHFEEVVARALAPDGDADRP
jgi:aryl-alcohol dehydrogenase-like predicted oxidoreductase